MKNTISINDVHTIGDPIIEKGEWSEDFVPMFNINYSSILSKLIKEAGKHCDYYASDLFIDWSFIEKLLHDHNFEGGRFIFGFRDCGVDGNTYFECWLNNKHFYGENRYKAVYVLDIEIDENFNIKMTLDKADI